MTTFNIPEPDNNRIRKIMSPKIVGKNTLQKPSMTVEPVKGGGMVLPEIKGGLILPDDIIPEPIDFKIKENWIELDKTEWEYESRL